MDRRQDRIILVKRIRPRAATRCVRWIEGQLGEKPLSAFVASRDLFQLGNIGGAEMSVIVQPLQVWLVPLPNELKFRWPSRFAVSHSANKLGKARPIFSPRLRHLDGNEKVLSSRLLLH